MIYLNIKINVLQFYKKNISDNKERINMIFDLRIGKKDKELILVEYQTRLSKTDDNRYIMKIP